MPNFHPSIPRIDLGFTGTRKGMTKAQRSAFIDHVTSMAIATFHMGCCIGADEEAACLVYEIGSGKIHGHPPIIDLFLSTTAIAVCDILHPAKEYHQRNRDIVNSTSIIIATPETAEEKIRSGTWSTVRYSTMFPRKRTLIIRPDGITHHLP